MSNVAAGTTIGKSAFIACLAFVAVCCMRTTASTAEVPYPNCGDANVAASGSFFDENFLTLGEGVCPATDYVFARGVDVCPRPKFTPTDVADYCRGANIAKLQGQVKSLEASITRINDDYVELMKSIDGLTNRIDDMELPDKN